VGGRLDEKLGFGTAEQSRVEEEEWWERT